MLSPMLFATLLAVPTHATAPVDTTLRISRGTTITVDGGMAPVTVRGTDGDNLTVQGAEVSHDGREVSIDGGMPFRGHGGPIVVSAPRWATVSVSTINGAITIEDAPASIDAETVNGRITTDGGSGTMSLSSATGGVTVRHFAGSRLDIEAVAGRVVVDGASGSIEVQSVNDPIELRNITASSVDASSTNGSIEWTGGFNSAGRYHFESHNGIVLLTVPRSLDARLRITSFNGGFDSAIPATTTGNGAGNRHDDWPGEREITATYGRGSATVVIETFNGRVRVRGIGDT